MNIEIINVSNGNNDYIGNFTIQEKKIIKKHCIGNVLNLFSGKSNIGDIRVDYTYGNIKDDVFHFLSLNKDYFDTIIIDAPYNKWFAEKYQKLNDTPEQFIIFADANRTTTFFDLIQKIAPTRLIMKSWNYFIPKGYFLKIGFLCYARGYRKPTLLLILDKLRRLDRYIRKASISRTKNNEE